MILSKQEILNEIDKNECEIDFYHLVDLTQALREEGIIAINNEYILNFLYGELSLSIQDKVTNSHVITLHSYALEKIAYTKEIIRKYLSETLEVDEKESKDD